MDEKRVSEEIVEAAEEVKEEAEEAASQLSEGAENGEKRAKNFGSKLIDICEPITRKVRDIVLGFGEVIVTISVIIGIVTAIIGGLADMGNIGFFTGLVNMIGGIVSVVMGALVIFLLFAIKKNGDK